MPISPSDRLSIEDAERTPPLLRWEVATLKAELARNRNGPAADRLIRGHLHIVVKHAVRFARTGIPVADLFEMGTIALRHAIARYDPRRTRRLHAFVSNRIRRAMRLLTRFSATRIAAEARSSTRSNAAPVNAAPVRAGPVRSGMNPRFRPFRGGVSAAPSA